jgi:hypothetical protein
MTAPTRTHDEHYNSSEYVSVKAPHKRWGDWKAVGPFRKRRFLLKFRVAPNEIVNEAVKHTLKAKQPMLHCEARWVG